MATRKQSNSSKNNPFELDKAPKAAKKKDVHVFGNGIVCDTDTVGKETPRGQSRFEIVVDASEGFIPLWAKGQTLRWRFQESSMKAFKKPAQAKAQIRKLLGESLVEWGTAAPIKFAERTDNWDFEISMRNADKCSAAGCVLASAFFPDAGRHELVLYPEMFKQSKQEQLETFIHEIGHIFGLRHFFAVIHESKWPAEVFGVHKKFSIMNYGEDSKLTSDDKADLRRLYQKAWAGELTEINGTDIKLVKPFHTIGTSPDAMATVTQLPGVHPQPVAAFTVE
ncbi:MAG TPA: matrixin family metalloprotease [Thermoanaerobaculia bacterium]|nr:matrixin family metalloprotease [Thermoanaerobaculia bacterium]